MKVIFFGTPQIAVPSLEYLCNKSDIEVLAVVTQPDKPAGRGKKLTKSPVKLFAEEAKITVYQPTLIRKDSELIETLKDLKPDIFITFAFGQILSQEVLDVPRLGTVNLHASLLPKYRGANPIQQAIVNGDKVTGVTTMLTELGVDTGPMLIKKEIEITENMTSGELFDLVSKISPEVIYETITRLNNETIEPTKQNDEESTHAPKFKKEDGFIDWDNTAESIHDKIRGMNPWPSAYSTYNENPIKIIESELIENAQFNASAKSGEIINITKRGVEVKAKDNVILIKKLQPQGKKPMNAFDWCNGARVQVGSCFE